MTWKKQPVLTKHMRRKREKKVTFEAAYCILLKKRKDIFRRRSFFTTKHKILKSQKRQHLKQPVLMKHMTWKKQPVLRKHMTWKKQLVLRKHMRWKREKRSNILRIDTLSQFFLYIQSDVFFHQMMIFSINKGKYLGNKNLFGSWFVGLSDMLNIPAAEHIWQLFDSFVSFFHTNMFSTKQRKQKMFFLTIVTNVASTQTMLLKSDYF